MADDEAPEAPEAETNLNSQFETQALAALEANDKQAQAVVTQMMDGTLTQAEGQVQLKAVRDKDAQIGTIYGQAAGGLQQVKGLLAEMEKGGAKAATVARFQRRVDRLFAGKPDTDLGADLAEELKTGVESRKDRVATRGSRRTDNEMLLDPKTPMEKIREIRSRQRKAETW